MEDEHPPDPPADGRLQRMSSSLSLEDSDDDGDDDDAQDNALEKDLAALSLSPKASKHSAEGGEVSVWKALSEQAWEIALRTEVNAWKTRHLHPRTPKKAPAEEQKIEAAPSPATATTDGTVYGHPVQNQVFQEELEDGTWSILPVSEEYVVKQTEDGLLLLPNTRFNSSSASLAASLRSVPGNGRNRNTGDGMEEAEEEAEEYYLPDLTHQELLEKDLQTPKLRLRDRIWTHPLSGLRSAFLGYRRVTDTDHNIDHRRRALGNILGELYHPDSRQVEPKPPVYWDPKKTDAVPPELLALQKQIAELEDAAGGGGVEEEEGGRSGKKRRNPLSLLEAEPLWTNFTESFKDCLDYIFYSQAHLETVWRRPLPTVKQARKQTALPNTEWPSDHLLLHAQLRWK